MTVVGGSSISSLQKSASPWPKLSSWGLSMRSLDHLEMQALLQSFIDGPWVVSIWARRVRLKQRSSLLGRAEDIYTFTPEEIKLVLAKAALLGVTDAQP